MDDLLNERLRLLLVDDDRVDRMAVRRTLASSTLIVDVEEAGDADTALQLLAQQPFDCVLLDYNLPGMNGLEVLEAMRARGIPASVVMLTGQTDMETAVQLLTAGAADFIPKASLSADRLTRAIRGAVRIARAEQAVRDHRIALESAVVAAEKARTEAETANSAKSKFMANMSHELRTPLNAIGGFTELMSMGVYGPVTSEQTTALARVKRAQEHLLGLINSVLNFAKLQAGHIAFEVHEVHLDTVLRDVAVLVQPQMLTKQLTYEYRPVGDPQTTVCVDADKLQQIVLNLLSNAVKFTAAGGSVTLSWYTTPERVEICVSDTGMGIAADKLQAVFEPFVQVTPDLTSSGQGTGLGLAISRDLAHAMGGELNVQSVLNEGSTFTLLLPRA